MSREEAIKLIVQAVNKAKDMGISFPELQAMAERERFHKYLEEASKQVEQWPEWKRNIFGGIKK